MIHFDDEQNLQRMLGVDTIPDGVTAEYELRRSFFDKAGATGPIGVIALMDLLRHVGAVPKVVAPKIEKVDFTKHRRGTPIEALYGGGWQPGIYIGMLPDGLIEILLDGETFHRECRNGPDILRLRAVSDTVSREVFEANEFIEPLVVTGVSLDGAELSVETVPLGELLTTQAVAPESQEDVFANSVEDDAKVDLTGLAGPIHAPQFHAGDPVWVEHNDDYEDATFFVLDGGLATVKLKGTGETLTLDVSKVQHAGK